MTKSWVWPFSDKNDFYSATSGMLKHHVVISLLALVGIVVFTTIFLGIVSLILQVAGYGNPKLVGLFQFVFFILGVWAYIRLFENRKFYSLGFTGSQKLYNYFRGVFVAIIFLIISVAVISIFAEASFTMVDGFGIESLVSVLMVLVFFVIQGASEEILMRGWFMQSVSVRHSPWLGILLSTSIFTLLHAANPNISIVAIVNIFLIGFFLALFILFDGSIWAACGFHTTWNFVMNSVLGINVSGNQLMGSSALTTQFSGDSLISGGEFGLEGSVVVSGVILVATVLLWVSKARRLNRNRLPLGNADI